MREEYRSEIAYDIISDRWNLNKNSSARANSACGRNEIPRSQSVKSLASPSSDWIDIISRLGIRYSHVTMADGNEDVNQGIKLCGPLRDCGISLGIVCE